MFDDDPMGMGAPEDELHGMSFEEAAEMMGLPPGNPDDLSENASMDSGALGAGLGPDMPLPSSSGAEPSSLPTPLADSESGPDREQLRQDMRDMLQMRDAKRQDDSLRYQAMNKRS